MSWRISASLLALTLCAVVAVVLSNAASPIGEPQALPLGPVPATTLETSSTPQTDAAPESPSVVSQTASSSQVAASASASTSQTDPDLTAAGGDLLHSLVNILCLTGKGATIPGGSGSGVIIDSRGLILTAAHIGQYFLLENAPHPNTVTCTIRTGGPASDAYTASVVYVAPSWIEANADVLDEKNPTGTGQNDFAILAITGSAGKPIPSSFSYVPLSSNTPDVGEKVAIAGYSAQYLGNSGVENDLYPTVSFNPITNVYTFGNNETDVVSITGTPAAQEGSSGGGVADANDTLVGLVTTSAVSGDIQNHILNAITPLHIRASFEADMSEDLDTYLSSHSPSDLVNLFVPEATKLTQVLTDALFK